MKTYHDDAAHIRTTITKEKRTVIRCGSFKAAISEDYEIKGE